LKYGKSICSRSIQTVFTLLPENDDPTLKVRKKMICIMKHDSGSNIIDLNFEQFSLRPRRKMILEVEVDSESDELLIVVDNSIGLRSYAYNKDDLMDSIRADIEFLWQAYAKGDECELTDNAAKLAKRLRETFEEVASSFLHLKSTKCL